MKSSYIYISLFLLFTSACSSDLSSRIGGNFDSKKWKNDTLGCGNERVQMLEAIQSADENIKLLGDSDIKKLFGRPDKVDLFSRSQKFYLYYLEKGAQCEDKDAEANTGRVLEISLDALGRLHEINIRK